MIWSNQYRIEHFTRELAAIMRIAVREERCQTLKKDRISTLLAAAEHFHERHNS